MILIEKMPRSSQAGRGRGSKRGRGSRKLELTEDDFSEEDDNGGIEILNQPKKQKTNVDIGNYVDIQIDQFKKEYDTKLNNQFRILCTHLEEANKYSL